MKESSGAENEHEKIGEYTTIFRRGERWYVNFQHDGKQHRKSLRTTSKKQAKSKAIQIEADLAEGRFTQEKRAPSVKAVIDLYRKYLQTEGRSKSTLAKYERAFSDFLALAERMKVKTLLGVDRRFVDAFRNKRVKDGAEPMTVHTDTVILRQVVNFALERDLVSRDPLRGLKLKKPKRRPQPCWTIKELERILAIAAEPHRSIFIVLAETGMRVGELKHLTWTDIDFDNGVIHIREKEGWKPKTGDARVIPMSDRARDVLAKLPHRASWVFTAARSSKYPQGDHPISERRLLEYLKRVLKKLGLPGHVHTFRHHFISAALTKGTPETVVRQWVGHVDREVMKRYTHVADEISKSAMQRLTAEKTKELESKSSEDRT
jgi:integrase